MVSKYSLYYQRNKERRKAQTQAWREANSAKVIEQSKKQCAKNSARIANAFPTLYMITCSHPGPYKGAIYIGLTRDTLHSRFYSHRRKDRTPMGRLIRELGEAYFTIHDMGQCSPAEAGAIETLTIKDFRMAGYTVLNKTDGGEKFTPARTKTVDVIYAGAIPDGESLGATILRAYGLTYAV